MATTRFEAKQFLRDLLFLAAQRGGTEVVAIAGAPPAIKQQDQLTPLASHVLTSSQMQALTRALLQSRTGNEAQLRRGLFGTVKVAEKMWWRFRFQSHHSESTLRFSLLVAKEISLAKLGAPDKVLESASVSSGLLFVACRWPSWLHAVLSGLAIHRFYNGLGYTGTFEKATLRDHPAIIDALGEPVTACDDCSLTARLERFVAVADTQDVTALLLPPDPDPDVLQAAIEASRRLLCIVPVPAADQADGWANWLHERAVAMSDDVRERWLADIAATLVGAMRVRPVPRREVSGTTMAWSWLRRTDRLRIVIAAGKLSRLSALQCDPTQRLYGMLAFDDDLFDLHEAGNISYEDALRNADNSNAFRLAIKLKSRKRINTSCADEHLCILGSDPALKTLPPPGSSTTCIYCRSHGTGKQ